jgi:hypothetical protein
MKKIYTRGKKFQSKVFLVRNWMGGTNLLSGLKISLEGSDVSISCPEVDAWEKGLDLSLRPHEINTNFQPLGEIYFFRNPDVCINFFKKNHLTSEDVKIIVQIRHPLDLLIAEFYGDSLRHFAPKGHEEVWSKLRKNYIKEGVDAFCKRRALELELSLSKYEEYRECISIISYEQMVLSPKNYVEELFSLFEFLPSHQFERHAMIDAIDINGGYLNTEGKRRMNSKLEWPFPGRSEWVLKDKLIIEIMNAMQIYMSFFKIVETTYVPVKPPILARKIPTFLLKIICAYRFQIKPWLKNAKSKF